MSKQSAMGILSDSHLVDSELDHDFLVAFNGHPFHPERHFNGDPCPHVLSDGLLPEAVVYLVKYKSDLWIYAESLPEEGRVESSNSHFGGDLICTTNESYVSYCGYKCFSDCIFNLAEEAKSDFELFPLFQVLPADPGVLKIVGRPKKPARPLDHKPFFTGLLGFYLVQQ